MRKSWMLVVTSLALGTTLSACKTEEPAPAATTAPAKAEPSFVEPSELSPEEPKNADALTAAELGDEAEATIAPDQLENELDRLEAEIALGF